MKTLQLTVLLLITPLIFFAQSLTGLWVGTVSNDSASVRKDNSFEIVLTQYKDKVYGYSRSTFIVNDTLYYIVKRVKGTIEGDLCEVKDDEVISYNFKGRLDKGVKMISTFRLDHGDSTWRMDGDWKTNKTKKYYSVSGKIDLKTEPDFEKSKIFPHLEELKLADDVAFYKESKKAAETTVLAKQTIANDKKEPVTASIAPVKKEEIRKEVVKSEPVVQTKQPVKEDKPAFVAVKESKKGETVSVPVRSEPATDTKTKAGDVKTVQGLKEEKSLPVTAINQPAKEIRQEPIKKEDKPAVTAVKEIKKEEDKIPAGQDVQKSQPIAAIKPVEQKKETVPEITNKAGIIAVATVIEKDKEPLTTSKPEVKTVVPLAAVFVAERKVAAPQTVFFRSDSLELSLYDNGEVDGDTVSVLLNGELILAKQGLKASAIKKTIYVPAGQADSLTLVLYAENLGKYPPNTGLLVVHDGDDVYQIRFSADLQQNAAILFKRKPK